MKKILILFVAMGLFAVVGAGCFARRLETRRVAPPVAVVDEAADFDVEHSSSTVVATLLVENGDEVTIHRAGQEFAGENNMQIAYGDGITVRTGEATLSYPDTGITTLAQGTKVTITVPSTDDGEGEEAFFIRLDVTVGNIWTRLERLLGPTEAFQASGNSVVATVRGTAFSFGVDGEDVDVTVAENEVAVADEGDPSSAFRMKPGEAFRAKLADMRAARDVTSDAKRKRFVRAMTAIERERPAFKAMQQKVREDLMNRPDRPVFLPIKPRINKEMLERLTPEQRLKFLRRLRASMERARLMQQQIVPNPLLPLPLQLIRPIATTTR